MNNSRLQIRFSLSQLLVLCLGIAIGFMPLQFWRAKLAPKPQVAITLQLINAKPEDARLLGVSMDELSNISAIVGIGREFDDGISRLRQLDAKAFLWAPTLLTVSGETALMKCVSATSYPTGANDGSSGVATRDVGTQVSVTPTVLRNGNIRLKVSPKFWLLDQSKGVTVADTTVPGIETRSSTVSVEIKAGQRMIFSAGKNNSDGVAKTLLVVVSAERISIK